MKSAAKKKSAGAAPGKDADTERFRFVLFLSGEERNSVKARRNLSAICSEFLSGSAEVEIIDVFEAFERALQERVIVTPTLVAELGGRKIRILGNLDDTARVVAALGLDRVKP